MSKNQFFTPKLGVSVQKMKNGPRFFLEAFFTKSFKTKYTTEKSEIRRFQGAFQGLDSSIGKWFGVREHYGKAIFVKKSDF